MIKSKVPSVLGTKAILAMRNHADIVAQSVYEKSLSLCSGKAAEHERDHGNVEKGFGMLRSGLVVADQAA
ncbi:MAG: hypothetical protein ACYC23_19755, partial [Limisphaerales bacterium]